MSFQENRTQEEVNQEVTNLLEKRNKDFQDGIMSHIYPENCNISVVDQKGTMELTMTEFMSNPIGIVHGGMLVTIFDTCGGILSRILTGNHSITTTDIQTSFLKPVQIGDRVKVEVKMTARGKSILHVTGELLLPDGSIGATASMTYYIFKKPLDKRQFVD